MENCHALCSFHNNRHEYKPEEYTAWMKQKLGDEGFAELDRKAHSPRKLTYLELWELRDEYRLLLATAMKEGKAA